MSALQSSAEKKFGPLTDAEVCLLSAAPNGEVADCSGTDNYENPANDPHNAPDWNDSRSVRASLLTWLYLDRSAAKQVHPTGITIWGANILGELDFFYTTLDRPIEIDKCFLGDGIDFSHAETRTLMFRNCLCRFLRAVGVVIKGDLLLQGSEIRGLVDLYASEVAGHVDFRQSRILVDGQTHAEGEKVAIGAELARVSRHLRCEEGFETNGVVRLVNARVDGNFTLRDSAFIGISRNGLDARRLYVGGAFEWIPKSYNHNTFLDLREAEVSILVDTEKSWPSKGNLQLDGLLFRRLGNESPTSAESRLDWLNRQPGEYRSQPFLHTAKVLRELGRDREAIDILIAKEDAKTRYGSYSRGARLWRSIERKTIGYGYRPLLALWFIGFFASTGSLLFYVGYRGKFIAPTETEAFNSFRPNGGSVPDNYEPFNSIIYSLETFFPLVDLGQKKKWAPCQCRKVSLPSWLGMPPLLLGSCLRAYLYIHMLAGWFFTVMLATGVSGLVRKE